MVNEKETKRKLQECAMKEFSEKGYMKASLRNICREAGVTTGALYFFFEDKEDLFASLVDEPIRQLQLALQDHFSAEMEVTKKVFHGADIDNNVLLNQEITVDKLVEGLELDDDMQIARMIVNFLFTYRDAFNLLLTKAQGSRYENYFDNIVEMVEAHYMKLYMVMKGYKSKREVTKEDKFIVKILGVHKTEEEARDVEKFYIESYRQLIGKYICHQSIYNFKEMKIRDIIKPYMLNISNVTK